jgi:hypothetical protein
MKTASIMVNFLTANGNRIECFGSISQMIDWINHPLNNTFYNIIYDIEFIRLDNEFITLCNK